MFSADYVYQPDLVHDNLVELTKNVALPEYLNDVERVARQNALGPAWADTWTQPPKAPPHSAQAHEFWKIGKNFQRGVYLAIHGLSSTDAAPVVPKLVFTKLFYNFPALKRLTETCHDSNELVSIWRPEFEAMADSTYDSVKSHHASLSDWAERAGETDLHPSVNDRLSFTRGYCLTMAFAKSVIQAEVQFSFAQYMTTGVFDESEMAEWSQLESQLGAEPSQ